MTEPPPAAADPNPLRRPKLADLFVLTFCVSVFLTGCRYAFGSDYNFVLWRMSEAELLGYGVGVACCWTGVFRVLRPGAGRPPLPSSAWQPGEVICLVEGAYYLIVAVIGAAFRHTLLKGAATVAENVEEPIDLRIAAFVYAAPPLVLCFGYVWLARRVTAYAWRCGAIAKVVSHAATPVLLLVLVSLNDGSGALAGQSASLAVSVLLLLCVAVPTVLITTAAWGDRRRRGVHWLHWLGIFAFAVIHLSRFSLEVRALVDLVGY